jgi:hypothetical protein
VVMGTREEGVQPCRGNAQQIGDILLRIQGLQGFYATSYRGNGHGAVRKVITMGIRQKGLGMIVILATLLLGSAELGDARKGGHGGGGHGGGRHGGHHGWHGGARIGIGLGIGPFWGPYWGGYWRPYAYGYPYAYPYGYPYAYPYGYPYAYAYPPVVAAPSTQLSLQPSSQAPVQPPPVYWYYCDASQGYYPYVHQCPGGWRTVTPTPP